MKNTIEDSLSRIYFHPTLKDIHIFQKKFFPGPKAVNSKFCKQYLQTDQDSMVSVIFPRDSLIKFKSNLVKLNQILTESIEIALNSS